MSAATTSAEAAPEAALIYSMAANSSTRAIRLLWFFDDADQFAAAWKLASETPGANPTRLSDAAEVPEGDFITDAGEFANWLRGEA